MFLKPRSCADRCVRAGGQYRVVKNRLAKQAVKGSAFESLGEHVSRSNGRRIFSED